MKIEISYVKFFSHIKKRLKDSPTYFFWKSKFAMFESIYLKISKHKSL